MNSTNALTVRYSDGVATDSEPHDLRAAVSRGTTLASSKRGASVAVVLTPPYRYLLLPDTSYGFYCEIQTSGNPVSTTVAGVKGAV